MSYRIAAIVLAAGLSSRLAPRNKLLSPMPDRQMLIAHTVRQAVAAAVQKVIVVTGYQAERVKTALAGLPVDFAFTADFAEGVAASLRTGISALPAEIDAALIMLGDMPLIKTALLNALLAAYNPQDGRDIVVPVWQGQRGNPRLLGRRYFSKISSLTGDAGAGKLLADYPGRIAEVAAPSDAVLRDFDTQAALDALCTEG